MSNDKSSDCVAKEKMMRGSFEAELPRRIERASRINLQQFIPAHWFSSAASECASMYIAGFFYGAISVAQAYVEALSRFLAETHTIRVGNDVPTRWQKLLEEGVVSLAAHNAAILVFAKRNDFHHLNKDVELDFQELEKRAEACINHLHTIESEIFACSFDEPGKITPQKPRYWPEDGPGLTRVNLRQLW